MIRSLSYSWGLYPRDQTSEPVGPTVAVSWIAPDLPPAVAGAFASEGLGGLAGTFGDETLGESVEIDDLDVEMDTDRIRIRVYNRGIGLMQGMGPDLSSFTDSFRRFTLRPIVRRAHRQGDPLVGPSRITRTTRAGSPCSPRSAGHCAWWSR
jgi:hypothetical protein